MRSYDKYKDSEIFWLPAIPDHWSIDRIKDVSETQSGTTPTSSNRFYYEGGEYNWIRTTDLNDGELYEVEYKVTDLALKECRLKFLPVHTLLVAMYGGFGTIGKNSILKKESTINQSVCAILPTRYFNPNYVLYFLKYFRNNWKLFADGTRKDPNINQDAVRNLFFINPPLDEQTAIAEYLDTKTQAIDKKIKLLDKKIGYYQELHKSLINETVTKGLDKTVKLKNSGIDWIGLIPEHWQVKRLKNAGNIETSSVNKKIEEDEKLIKLVNYVNVYNNPSKEIWNSGNFMAVSANELQIRSKRLKKGDALITPSSETIEDIGVSSIVMENLKNTLYSYHLIRLRFTTDFDIHFKKYMLNNDKVQYYFSHSATGTTRKILGLNTFYNLPIVFPPTKKEQEQIGQFLKNKTSRIDQIITNIQTQITTLKELRKTLINDVVTGIIKVTA